MTDEPTKGVKSGRWQVPTRVSGGIQALAAVVAVLATAFSAGYLYSRAETSHEQRIRWLEEQWETDAETKQIEELRGRIMALERADSAANAALGGADPAPNAAVAVESFSTRNRVRCPGGGDWFNRNRNRRTGSVTYTAPEHAWITEVHTRVLNDNSGGLGQVDFEDFLDGDRNKPRRAQVNIWCDPPDFPGAAGGWMEVELYGTLGRDSTEGEP